MLKFNLDKVRSLSKSLIPYAIFATALYSGIRIDLWLMDLIVIISILFYTFHYEERKGKQFVLQQIVILALYGGTIMYRSHIDRDALKTVESICYEQDRQFEDQCDRIISEIENRGSSGDAFREY